MSGTRLTNNIDFLNRNVGVNNNHINEQVIDVQTSGHLYRRGKAFEAFVGGL